MRPIKWVAANSSFPLSLPAGPVAKRRLERIERISDESASEVESASEESCREPPMTAASSSPGEAAVDDALVAWEAHRETGALMPASSWSRHLARLAMHAAVAAEHRAPVTRRLAAMIGQEQVDGRGALLDAQRWRQPSPGDAPLPISDDVVRRAVLARALERASGDVANEGRGTCVSLQRRQQLVGQHQRV